MPASRADTTLPPNPATVTDPVAYFGSAGAITFEDGAPLQVVSSDTSPIGNSLILGGGGGTINLRFNNNEGNFHFTGPITSTASGAQTLAIVTGCQGNGDREEVTFDSGIPDASGGTSVQVTFNTQSDSYSFVNLKGDNTFTGPINLVKGDNVNFAYLTIGGRGYTPGGNQHQVIAGSGTLATDYPGAISLGTNTILSYASSAPQNLAGAISGPGALEVDASGTLTLSGANTYHGNTTVNSGTLVLADGAGLGFVVSDGSSNKLTGGGTATLNGSFTIDTSAVTTPIASWTLVDVSNKTYGPNFSVTDFTGPGLDNVWTKVDGAATWIFDASSGVLSVNTVATMTAFGIPGYVGTIDGGAMTVHLFVPYGTDLATLAPNFTITTGTCDQTSGAPPSPTFAAASTVTYTVVDGAASHAYVVTVTPLPPGPAGVNGPVLWLDASQLTGLGNGGSVDTWTDLSGYDHTAARSNGSMTYVTGQLNSLPAVQFRGNGQANIAGTMNAQEQYIVFRLEGGDWGSVLGSQTRSGYLMNPSGYFWNGNFPSAVKQNGTTVSAQPYQLSNIGTFMVLKITGNNGDTSVRSGWALGLQEGWGSLNMDVAEIIAYDHPLSGVEEDAVGGYLTAKYLVDTTYPVGPQKNITSFTFPTFGDATIVGTNIVKYVPNGTPLSALTTLAPTFTLSTDATCDPASGSTHDFSSGAVHYLVTASDASTKEYTATVTILPPGPPVAGYARWFDASALGLTDNAPVTHWNDGSGNGANATVPGGNATPTYVADAGTESGLGAIHFVKNDGAGDSAALGFSEDANIRTVFSVFKGSSFLLTDASAYDFHRPSDDNPGDPLYAGYASGNVIGGSTYVNGTLVDGTSYGMPTGLHNGFNLVEVLTTDKVHADSFNKDRSYHAGNQYQAEVIIYDFVLSDGERLAVEQYLMSKWFATAPSGYGSWASANVGGQTADQDYNNDGVPNGIAYFMGATGIATNPGVVNGAVAWPHSASATGITYKVLTSANLADWTDVTGDAIDAGGFLTYTLPTGDPTLFVRLEVLVP